LGLENSGIGQRFVNIRFGCNEAIVGKGTEFQIEALNTKPIEFLKYDQEFRNELLVLKTVFSSGQEQILAPNSDSVEVLTLNLFDVANESFTMYGVEAETLGKFEKFEENRVIQIIGIDPIESIKPPIKGSISKSKLKGSLEGFNKEQILLSFAVYTSKWSGAEPHPNGSLLKGDVLIYQVELTKLSVLQNLVNSGTYADKRQSLIQQNSLKKRF
jgi:hypothetical protein